MRTKKIIQSALEETKLPSIHISVTDKPTNCIDSKFGGIFYLPQEESIPTCPEGEQMQFLAQINFAKMPHIEGFPEKGLLQFFMDTDETRFEEKIDDPEKMRQLYAVRYYPSPDMALQQSVNTQQFTPTKVITTVTINGETISKEEYEKRLKEQIRLARELNIPLIQDSYRPQDYEQAVQGYEDQQEGGKRCYLCYRLRLLKTALKAKALQMDYFTTTLSVSPYKNSRWINEIGYALEQELKILLLPKDPNDDKNVIVEIRAGAGGDEAALFAAEMYRLYVKYAERRRWKVETVSADEIGIGGMKEVTFMVTGKGAYSRLKYESGVHRVQRVPETESQGRVHTSTTTVAVLPEAEEVDFYLDPNDLRIDTFRSSGAGGQHINKTSSAIRVTHIPTGTVVECQDERSQHKNKDKALRVLRSRLYEAEVEKQQAAIAADRKSQVGTGDRSERIRTYNFPQGRVTDHRIGLTLYKLGAVLDGDLDELIDGLILADETQKQRSEEP